MKKAAFIIGCLFLPAVVNAGWMIESKSSDGDSRKTNIEGNLLCDESAGGRTIIHMNSRQITVADNKSRTYATSTLDEIKKSIEQSQAIFEKTIEENMKNLPPDQQASYRQMMGSKDAKKPDLKIQQAGSEKIAGFNSSKYQVFSNGKMIEEIWTSSEAPFFSAGFGDAMASTAIDVGGMSYKSDQKYLEIMKSGYPLKQRTLDTMGIEGMHAAAEMPANWSTEEVKTIQKMDVEKYLTVPSGYKKKPYMEFMQSEYSGSDN
jgi:hypothetical protein